jgi:hypothetical protein
MMIEEMMSDEQEQCPIEMVQEESDELAMK